MDGESVRIAKDVLRAGAPSIKICLPASDEELHKALEHRGRRRPVVIGDDRALLRTVGVLHRQRRLADAAVSLVPVGPRPATALARALGVPQSAVSAARAALDGTERALDLLVDDSGGIVLDALRIPGRDGGEDAGAPARAERGRGHWLERGARSLVRTLAGPLPSAHPGGQRLRVEADGVVLADLDRPVREISVRTAPGTLPGGGLAEVVVCHGPDGARPVRVSARAVTVSGRDFHYRADAAALGPVRNRTWTVQPRAWRLTVPGQP